ncbi:peroxisomal carnitine O-octanoyltransferase-like isoform X6 [Gadus macrocephalus]|nr:peroxisomal carnitine O-octanoyltransferase-like isoform X6 [Gadus macrocephalus]
MGSKCCQPGLEGCVPYIQCNQPELEGCVPYIQCYQPGLEGCVPYIQCNQPELEGCVPYIQCYQPGLEGCVPYIQCCQPGLEGCVPYIQCNQPELEGCVPYIQCYQPGLEGCVPYIQCNQPELEGCVPYIQCYQPGLEGCVPYIQCYQPGLEGCVPYIQCNQPGLEGCVPYIQCNQPELEGCVPYIQCCEESYCVFWNDCKQATAASLESEGPCPSHVVVLRRGRIFTFDALHDGKILSPPELLRQLQYVTECCEGGPEGDGVAALTSEERTTWAKAREHLISLDPVNTSILETIQSSLFVVSLDEAKPYATAEDYTPLTLAALAGDPTIRWGDKSYNSISYADGTFGCNCDHAPYDGMIMVSLSYYIDCRLRASGGKWKGSDMVRDISLPEELLFRLDDRVRHDVQLAKQHFLETANNLQVVCCAFTSFGKYAIKQRKLHPDTFVQLAMQLAYYRKHGRPGSCYETAMTRRFYHGRTETMRPCTQEAVLWCQAMTDPTCTEDVKRKALLKAFNKHNKLMALAQNGEGFDRHLLGLYLVAKEEGLPTPHLFRDPLYAKSGGGGNFVLSSSLVGYQTVVGVGAPMVLHGYGCFYNIRDDR